MFVIVTYLYREELRGKFPFFYCHQAPAGGNRFFLGLCTIFEKREEAENVIRYFTEQMGYTYTMQVITYERALKISLPLQMAKYMHKDSKELIMTRDELKQIEG